MRNIGLDFGTCYIKAAEKNNRGEINLLKLGRSLDDNKIKNIVLYQQKKEQDGYYVTVGENALKNINKEALTNTIKNIKSCISLPDWKKTLSFGIEVSAYDVVKEIMLYLFNYIYGTNKNDSDIHVTITVPVNFSKKQNDLIKKAAQSAGFKVDNVVAEPFAALFYFIEKFATNIKHNVLIFDCGGGTLDLCLATVYKKADNQIVDVVNTAGITFGGNDINQIITSNILRTKYKEIFDLYFSEKLSPYELGKNKYNLDFELDCLKASLFNEDADDILDLEESFVVDNGQDIASDVTVSVQDIYFAFEQAGVYKRISNLLGNLFALSDDILPNEITDIVMIGGSSSIPYFRNKLVDYFSSNGHTSVKTLFSINDSDDIEREKRLYSSVSAGAVCYSELINSLNYRIKNKTPFIIYAKDQSGSILSKLVKNNYFNDYFSPYSVINETIKKEGRLNIYQTVSGENDKEVFLGSFLLDSDCFDNTKNYAFRFWVDKDNDIYIEFAYYSDETNNYETIDSKYFNCN